MAGTLQVDPPAAAAPKDGAEEVNARVGAVLAGRYKLAKLLGAGGMGAVYEAEHLVTGRRVAVKVMLPSASKDGVAVERFLREARAASKIAHPNIIQVFDADRNPSDGALFLVEELLTGTDLQHVLEARHHLPPAEAQALLVPVIDALATLHREGIIHRDIKPANIFLADTPQGVAAKLIDFGIAKMTDPGDGLTGLTQSGALLGTPYYMSPEQARGARDVTEQTDVWAMGVVLYRVLAGRAPFQADNYNALMVSILNAPIPRLETLVPGIPKALADVVHRAIERDPALRYPSMDALRDALRSVSLVPGEAAAPPLLDTRITPVAYAQTIRGGSSRRNAIVLGALLVLIPLLAAVALHLSAPRPQPEIPRQVLVSHTLPPRAPRPVVEAIPPPAPANVERRPDTTPSRGAGAQPRRGHVARPLRGRADAGVARNASSSPSPIGRYDGL